MPERSPSDSLVGNIVDERYRICERLGAGGMGSVYRAERAKIHRSVAIKFLHKTHAADDGFVKRFEREALALSRLYHPHCVGLVDYGMSQGRPYLVMDYVPGKTLSQLLREEAPLEPTRAAKIMLQLLRTLEYFHGRNIVHRDLKAANVMLLDSENELDFVKLLDFGMAKLLAGVGADMDISRKGTVVGTPSAMSPEQIKELPLDGRSDVYSAGVLFYQMVTGRTPFAHTDIVQVMKMHLEREPTPPIEVAGSPYMSAPLESCILKALRKDRDERFGSASEMAAALAKVPELAPNATRSHDRAASIDGTRTSWSARLGWVLFACVSIVLLLVMFVPEVGRRVTGQATTQRPTERPRQLAKPSPASRPRQRPTAMPPATAITRPVDATPARDASIAKATVADARPVASKVVDAGAAVIDAAAPTPIIAKADWTAPLSQADSHIAAGRYIRAAAILRKLVRDQPQARRDPAVIRAAVALLQPTYGDRYIGFLAQEFRDIPAAVATLADRVVKGATWILRHHAFWTLQRMGKLENADQVAMWLADVKRSKRCHHVRASFAQLKRSKDPRARAAVAKFKPGQLRCL